MGPMHARYVYGVLFLIANFTAWGLRENPILFFDIQRRSGCHGNRDCFAAEAVLMISFTLFVSFQFYFHPMKHFVFHFFLVCFSLNKMSISSFSLLCSCPPHTPEVYMTLGVLGTPSGGS